MMQTMSTRIRPSLRSTGFRRARTRSTCVAIVGLLVVCACPALATSGPSKVSATAQGHADVTLSDHLYEDGDHWIELAGDATLEAPCGDRELEFQLTVHGYEGFDMDMYIRWADFRAGELRVVDPSASGLVVLQADLSGPRLAYIYPRPPGPSPYWYLSSSWNSTSRRVLLDDCTWSDPTDLPLEGSFGFRPTETGLDPEGMGLDAWGTIWRAVDVREPRRLGMGMLKARYQTE